MQTLTEVKHKVIEEKGSTIHLYTCRVGQYRIERDLIEFDNGSTRERLDIYPEGEYLPNIIFNRRRNGQNVHEFKIETVTYGSLSPDELKKVIAGYEHALEVVEVLNNEFLTKEDK